MYLTKQEKIVLVFLLTLALIGSGALFFKKSRQQVRLEVISKTE